ncbi:MAG: ChaN family lipoprotein [Pseudomonadota bacterium]|uniref:ChaN family lipoprotein n=1 Tax=Roseovarius TaxID=74030 RepID=UPI0022A810D9|nr:ChaN family lipoprotein [Roseovarius sp. EGI FJ00037]MCZ0813740.1 ChaN family lipoprotein [Roseovarius sp. EGI FJ00037]
MKTLFAAALALCLPSAAALAQDVLILGEVHDNPAHHEVQAKMVAAFAPRALVFEMLTPAQAEAVTPGNRNDRAALAEALDWEGSGWPDFALYHPIFTAAPEARIFGAQVPREAARKVFEDGPGVVFSGDGAAYGLTDPLPEQEQAAREALQMEAHCDALPEAMLPGMVAVQRLRDAELAHGVMRAIEATGGPVAVITGNGHARRDWGVPSYLARVAPGLEIRVIGQTEDGRALDGGFDEVLSAPMVEREDPCAAFAKGD